MRKPEKAAPDWHCSQLRLFLGRSRLLGEEGLDLLLERFRSAVLVGTIGDGHALTIAQEHVKVPAELLDLHLRLQELEQGQGLVAVDIDLSKVWKIGVELESASANVAHLIEELVAGEPEDFKALALVLGVQSVETLIGALCGTSFGCDVGDHHDFAFVVGHVHVLVLHVLNVKIEDAGRRLPDFLICMVAELHLARQAANQIHGRRKRMKGVVESKERGSGGAKAQSKVGR